MDLAQPRLRSRRRLWANREFLKLWAGQTVSLFGDQVSFLAFPLIGVLVLHASAAQMGMLTAAAWAPSLLAPFAGAWIDRRARHRRTMIAADVGRALLIVTIPAAAALDLLSIAHLYVVASGTGALAVLFDLSEMAYFMAVVEPGQVIEAQAKLNGSRAASQVGGPGIGGLLVQLLTAPIAILADALSFVGSALLLGRMQAKDPPAEPVETGARAVRRIAEGFRFLFRQPVLRASLGCAATLNFFTFALAAIFVLFASQELGLSAGLIGVALSAGAVGSVVGAATAERVGTTLGVGPAIIVGSILFPAPMALIPLASGPGPFSVAMLIASDFLAGIGVMYFDVNLGGLKLLVIAQRLRGRAYGAFRAINFGVRPVGAVFGGLLGDAIGLRPTLWIAVLGASSAFLWLLFSPIRSIRLAHQVDQARMDAAGAREGAAAEPAVAPGTARRADPASRTGPDAAPARSATRRTRRRGT